MYILTHKPIHIQEIISGIDSPESGGIVIFCGIVRNNHKNKPVDYLEYEAYEPLAVKKIQEICETAKSKWNLNQAICIHRLGRLEISDCAVLIITTSAHRNEAFEANRYIIDTVKADVPIWKNEFYTDGTSAWGRNTEFGKNIM